MLNRTIVVHKISPRNWACRIVGAAPVVLVNIKTPALALEVGQLVVKNNHYSTLAA